MSLYITREAAETLWEAHGKEMTFHYSVGHETTFRNKKTRDAFLKKDHRWEAI